VTDALPPIVVDERAVSLRQRFEGIDALVVDDLTNLRWLTGFTGSNGVGVVLPDQIVLVTDGRYGEQAERQLSAARCAGTVRVGRTGAEILDLVAATLGGIGRIGFESAHTSHQRFVQYAGAFGGELVPTVGLVERGRRRKDAAEIARIEQACAIADAALAHVAPSIVPGTTELEVRNRLEQAMRDGGAAGPSYETIVATGPTNAPLPHHRPTSTVIEDGHTVIIDVGALLDGYHSDMTRTFLVGEPSSLQREVYDVVLAAQRAGVAAVRPGLATRDLDAVCRDAITAAGFGPWFSHGTGHGVGLLIHEDPFVSTAGELELQVGDVVTVEPGVYRGDLGGVRVEDLVEVTSTGCRVLTASPKDAPCLPSAPTT
jgi:Xaa-Pro aminopeptidase